MSTERVKAIARRRCQRPWASALAVWALLLGCGGSVDSQVGGESHFLSSCEASCDGELSCISGVCTRDCSEDASVCSSLAANARCASAEPGPTASCDVSCSGDDECAALPNAPRCLNGVCRSANSSAATCRVGHHFYRPGANIPLLPVASTGASDTAECSACECQSDGTLDCQSAPCGAGAPVFECPEEVISEPLTIESASLIGGSIAFAVTHGGGCSRHDYALCYGPAFLESQPVQVGLRLIHDAHGDACDALLSARLKFDLAPLAAAYDEAYQTTQGVIRTSYGDFGFGELTCDERRQVVASQITEAVGRASQECSTSADCAMVSIDSSCTAACGAVIAAASSGELESELAAIDTGTCGGAAAACAPVIPPCVPPEGVNCVAGRCVSGTP